MDKKYEGSTPGPWKWQGEDYRGGWGWQILVDSEGNGLIVGQDNDGMCKLLKGHMPVEAKYCVTGLVSEGKERVNAVHVFSEANAKLIADAWKLPKLAEQNEKMLAMLKRWRNMTLSDIGEDFYIDDDTDNLIAEAEGGK